MTQASIPEVSKIVMDARTGSSFWQIGSVRSTRWSNMDCKSGKKSCLKRVNLEASGTTSNHKKCRIYAAFGVSQTQTRGINSTRRKIIKVRRAKNKNEINHTCNTKIMLTAFGILLLTPLIV